MSSKSNKPQYTPRLQPYSGRFKEVRDDAVAYLGKSQRALIGHVLSQQLLVRSRASIPEIVEEALDRISAVCWNYRDNGRHLRPSNIGKQKRSAQAIMKASMALRSALENSDLETLKRIFLSLGVPEDELDESLADGAFQYEQQLAATHSLFTAAREALERVPQKEYDSQRRRSAQRFPLPHYITNYLHELVEVWCQLFLEPFRVPKSSKQKSTKRGIRNVREQDGVLFIMAVMQQAEPDWQMDRIIPYLKKVREQRTKACPEVSEKSSDSDQARVILGA